MIETLFDYLPAVVMVTTLQCVLIFAPLGAFRVTRPFAGWALYVASWVFGASLWLYGAIFTFSYFSWVGLVVGVIVLGVGVVPLGLLATALQSQWEWFIQMAILLLSIIASRVLGLWHLAKTQRYED